MKLNLKRVFLVLCMAALLFSLSACAKNGEDEPIDKMESETMQQMAKDLVQEIASIPVNQIDELAAQNEKAGKIVIANALISWKGITEDLGDFKSFGEAKITMSEDGYSVDLDTVFSKRKMVFSLGINSDLTEISFISFNPHYTVMENMEQAALNTLLGMGTVFIILIFISILISGFKFISVIEAKAKGKQAGNEAQAPDARISMEPALSQEEPEELTDDLELVAVITAAIAAASHTCAEGLVVRSIRRAPASKWKKA